MAELLSWTWRTTSALHCGSGLAQAGRADRMVQVDEAGRPVIPGDAVKGAIRLAAEQVVAWLVGDPQEYDQRAPAEPRLQVLAEVFGGDGLVRFRPALITGEVWEQLPLVSSTAIDRERGTAAQKTLRTIETVPAGTCFGTACELLPGTSPEAKTLLVAALLAVEGVGGRVGSGFGRVDPEDATIDGQPVAEAVSGDALDRLREALAQPFFRPPRPTAARDSAPLSEMPDASRDCRWHRIVVELHEPTCVGTRPEISNVVSSLEFLPATTVRGALRAAWLRMGKTPRELDELLGPHTRWTAAHRASASDGDAPVVPVPLSYVRVKEEEDFGGPIGIRDVLAGRPEEVVDGARAQWRALSSTWMTAETSEGGSGVEIGPVADALIETRMHVARHYVSGSKRVGALYARQSIAAWEDRRARFVAAASLPAGSAWEGETEVAIGRRKSAGNGRATVRIVETSGPWPDRWSAPDHGRDVYVQLLAATLARDDRGYLQRTISIGRWAALTGLEPNEIEPLRADESGSACRTAATAVPSWMSTWRHGRAPVTAVAAGSVWRLRCRDDEAAGRLRQALGAIASDGLGERRHEGFGWIAVDPPWLGRKTPAAAKRTTETKNLKPPLPWPGVDDPALAEQQLEIVGALPESVRGDARRPLQELARLARERKPSDVLEFCRSRIGRVDRDRDGEEGDRRRDPGQWTHVPLDVLERAANDDDPRLFRFALEAALIRARSGGVS